MEFPALPNLLAYPVPTVQAYELLERTYEQARDLLHQHRTDPLRYRAQLDIIRQRAAPLLDALYRQIPTGEIPAFWVENLLKVYANLTSNLKVAMQAGSQRDALDRITLAPVRIVHTHLPGRPRKVISRTFLNLVQKADRSLTDAQVARLTKMSAKTVGNYRKLYGIRKQYSGISDQRLDGIVRRYKQKKPDAGIRYVWAHLRFQNVKITGLRASNNNKAQTVVKLFLDATRSYGIPSRVRGDRGGENIDVARLMIFLRGENRASFIWGTSTRNTRIERLWVEVGKQFVRRWKAFFQRLEDLHGLDIDNPQHLWLLHKLFLPHINDDCKMFRREWNAHTCRGSSTLNQSPNVLRLQGIIKHGAYDEDCDKLSPEQVREICNQHFGQIENNEHDLHVESVQVPEMRFPFFDPQTEDIFFDTVREAMEQGIMPRGFGIHQEEWPDDGYPTGEILKVGKNPEVLIALPLEIWFERALLWARGLYVMLRIQEGDLELQLQ
ncbi:hypothetical protein A7U60_g7887 [Sanghuangporus baumii]|uniref:Integrase core domain-containing protein n=1 Tax=Sanghuangporus baumii TaxID=108892 RepID=A0A9Q5MZN4_SANBA|nr:hypothetical protein A7U60_g7887 [Sanghuangporus baumii]